MNPESSVPRQRSPAVGLPLRRARLADVLQGSSISPAIFLAEFQSATDTDVQALEQAWRDGDAARVRQLAHRMEGAAMVVGADPFAAACAGLAAASSGDPGAFRGALEILLVHQRVLYAWIRARYPAAPAAAAPGLPSLSS